MLPQSVLGRIPRYVRVLLQEAWEKEGFHEIVARRPQERDLVVLAFLLRLPLLPLLRVAPL